MKQSIIKFRHNLFIMRAIAVAFCLNICSLSGFSAILVGTELENYDDSNYEYQELFTEGKEWIIWHGFLDIDNYQFQENHLVIYVSVDGEEIIDGIKCKRLKYYADSSGYECFDCRRNTVTGIKYFYGYEKDRIIYIYRNPGKKGIFDEWGNWIGTLKTEPYFDIYMDLNVELGEMCFDMGEIDKINYRDFNGTVRRVIASCKVFEGMTEVGEERNWIEGIGSNMVANQYASYNDSMVNRPASEHPGSSSDMYNSGSYNVLLQCSENGVTIYDNMDRLKKVGLNLDMVRNTSDIESIEINEKSKVGIYYNLQGIPVDNPQKGEIYIYNGKKLLF